MTYCYCITIQAHCCLDVAILFLDSCFICLEYNLKQSFRNFVPVKSFKPMHSGKKKSTLTLEWIDNLEMNRTLQKLFTFNPKYFS